MASLSGDLAPKPAANSKFHEQTNQNSVKTAHANSSTPKPATFNLRPKRKFPNENSYTEQLSLAEEKTPPSKKSAPHCVATPPTPKQQSEPMAPLANSPATLNATTSSKKPKALVNNEYCSYCFEGGNILNCDRCPTSFHLLCHEPPLNFDEIPAGEFICNKCKANSACGNDPASVNFNTNLVQFFKRDAETPLKTLTRMSKSFNPRQMCFPVDFGPKLHVNLPGLNKIEWLYANHPSKAETEAKTPRVAPINYELLYYISQVSTNYSPKSFTQQIAHNQYRDIHSLNQVTNQQVNGSNVPAATTHGVVGIEAGSSAVKTKTYKPPAAAGSSKNDLGLYSSNGSGGPTNMCSVCQK